MKKGQILKFTQPSGISHKHEPVFLGDVFQNGLGTKAIVLYGKLNGAATYYLRMENGACFPLAHNQKTCLSDKERIGNVTKDDDLMAEFITLGFIEDDSSEEIITGATESVDKAAQAEIPEDEPAAENEQNGLTAQQKEAREKALSNFNAEREACEIPTDEPTAETWQTNAEFAEEPQEPLSNEEAPQANENSDFEELLAEDEESEAEEEIPEDDDEEPQPESEKPVRSMSPEQAAKKEKEYTEKLESLFELKARLAPIAELNGHDGISAMINEIKDKLHINADKESVKGLKDGVKELEAVHTAKNVIKDYTSQFAATNSEIKALEREIERLGSIQKSIFDEQQKIESTTEPAQEAEQAETLPQKEEEKEAVNA